MAESSDQFNDSQSLDSEQRQKGSVPSFLTKLFDIMENGDLEQVISWNHEGTAFIVHNQNVFSEKILPKYFKHKNFPSFLRQLNMYNFKKSKDEGNQKFEHKWFRREGRQLLANIKRRNQEEQEDQDEIPQIVDEIEQFKKAQKELKTEIQAIADSQKQLQTALQMIMQQNETLFQESQSLTTELSNMQSKNQQRFANYSNILTEIVQRLQQEQEEIEKREQPSQTPQPTMSRQDSEQRKVGVIQIKQEQQKGQNQQLSMMMNQLTANQITMQYVNQMKQQCPFKPENIKGTEVKKEQE